jgi:hypothetical protein
MTLLDAQAELIMSAHTVKDCDVTVHITAYLTYRHSSGGPERITIRGSGGSSDTIMVVETISKLGDISISFSDIADTTIIVGIQ